jgi:23S rRNA (cytidine1920-2'-O)/16S rRNA (cytidine1409-2'-O)-methyltransferase
MVMERTNVRFLTSLPEQPRLAVVDVSFISLRLALPPVFALLQPDAPVVALVKPQFEAGRHQVGKGGVVRDPSVHRQVLSQLTAWSAAQGWRLADLMASPIRGPAGNVEFLSLWLPGAEPAAAEVVERALAEAALVGARAR